MMEEMQREIDEAIARGLPDIPPRIVEDTHALRLFEEVQPLHRFVIGYLELLSKAGVSVPYDTSEYDRYKPLLHVISNAKNFLVHIYGLCLKSALNCIEELQRGEIGYEEALRGIYGVARMMADERGRSLQGSAYAGDDFDEVLRDYEKRIGEQK